MLSKPAKNNQVSWETTQAFSVVLFFLFRPDIESAMVGWALLVTQKTVIRKHKKLFIICLLISGASAILIGITRIFDAIF